MTGLLLLATADNSRFVNSFREGFSHGEPDGGSIIRPFIISVGAISLILALAWAVRHVREGGRHAPRVQGLKLFSQCLRKLGVGFADRAVMRMAASHVALQEPSVMLFSPELMDMHAGRWAGRVSIGALRSFAMNRVRAVRDRVFPDAPAPTGNAPVSPSANPFQN